MPLQPNVTQGNAIAYSGLGTPVFSDYIYGAISVIFRESYTLDIIRPIVDDVKNEQLTEDIRDLEKWVIRQSIAGKAPRFGDPNYREKIWAQGGALYMVQQEDVPTPFAAYRTNIIIQYQEYYEEENY